MNAWNKGTYLSWLHIFSAFSYVVVLDKKKEGPGLEATLCRNFLWFLDLNTSSKEQYMDVHANLHKCRDPSSTRRYSVTLSVQEVVLNPRNCCQSRRIQPQCYFDRLQISHPAAGDDHLKNPSEYYQWKQYSLTVSTTTIKPKCSQRRSRFPFLMRHQGTRLILSALHRSTSTAPDFTPR